MSTKRKIDSARANGAKSHGPVTDQGRKKSSMNALKHGLTARTVLFSNDNHDEYNALLKSYIESLQPIDPVEMDLVVDMVNAKWQQRRVHNLETQLFDQEMLEQKGRIVERYESSDETFEQTYAFERLAHSPSLPMLHRMASRLERTYYRALNNLLRLRQVRESSNRKIEKRTESQDRTPVTNHQPPTTSPRDSTQMESSAVPALRPVDIIKNSDPPGAT